VCQACREFNNYGKKISRARQKSGEWHLMEARRRRDRKLRGLSPAINRPVNTGWTVLIKQN
jgi:ribosomal protein L44E